jgi:hypothetical protein
MLLLAQALAGWGVSQIVTAVIIVAAVVAVTFVALRAMGVTPPPWAIQIGWILVIAFVAIVAIRVLLSM